MKIKSLILLILASYYSGCNKNHAKKVFWDKDNPEMIANYDQNNQLNGKYAEFYINGDTCISANYVHGKLNGVLTTYYCKGKVCYSVLYDMNALKSIVAYNDSLGNPFSTSLFHNGNGYLNVYSIYNREITATYKYEGGFLNGYSYTFLRNGNKDSTYYSNGIDTSSHRQDFLPPMDMPPQRNGAPYVK